MQTVLSWVRMGQVVRDARRARTWSQTDLAGHAGVSRAWVARLEAGHRRAEIDQLFRVLHALDLTLYVGEQRRTAGEMAVLEALEFSGQDRR
jgi:HTH-type transcriptional regulator/antitoxin HipB